MKKIMVVCMMVAAFAADAFAQESTNTGVRRRDQNTRQTETSAPGVTDRMQSFYDRDGSSIGEGDVQWMRTIYRQLDLDKDVNAALYFPEDPIDGQENLFRILIRVLSDNKIKAYEYLDGREIFTENYQVKARDVFDRFHIYYTEARGSSERNPLFNVEDVDVPANEVLSYYIIERWEFDTRNNRVRTYVEAICPVLHRSGDFGGEAVKYPMFWVKFSDIRPYLAQQAIFVSDDNNMPTCSYDDFFNLNMYEGEIYKTRNLRNRSMMQLYPDPDDMRRAQDSIQQRLVSFEDKLWVPDREEVIRARGGKQNVVTDSLGNVVINPDNESRSVRNTSRNRKPKVENSRPANNSSTSAPTRSVRRTRR